MAYPSSSAQTASQGSRNNAELGLPSKAKAVLLNAILETGNRFRSVQQVFPLLIPETHGETKGSPSFVHSVDPTPTFSVASWDNQGMCEELRHHQLLGLTQALDAMV